MTFIKKDKIQERLIKKLRETLIYQCLLIFVIIKLLFLINC